MATNCKILARLAIILAVSQCNGNRSSSTRYKKIVGPSSFRSSSSLPSTGSTSTSTTTARLLHPQRSSAISIQKGGGIEPSVYDGVDWIALVKYTVGIAAQLSLIFGFLTGIDQTLARFSLQIPFAANVIFFYAFNLKSSLFSILPTSDAKETSKLTKDREDREYTKRIPTWTPPGIAFVFGWPLLTFGLRAFTAAMIVQQSGRYATPAIMSLMLHFCIGNLWNTANNVERRVGVSVVLLYSMWITKAFAAWQFYRVNPRAGKLLAVTLSWITAAVALQTRTWQINPDPDTGKREPLVPRKHPKWSTKFRWEP